MRIKKTVLPIVATDASPSGRAAIDPSRMRSARYENPKYSPLTSLDISPIQNFCCAFVAPTAQPRPVRVGGSPCAPMQFNHQTGKGANRKRGHHQSFHERHAATARAFRSAAQHQAGRRLSRGQGDGIDGRRHRFVRHLDWSAAVHPSGRLALHHDMRHVMQLHPMLHAGDILLGDRAYCTYAHLVLLQLQGLRPSASLRLN
jgi:hypothetical protein